MRKILDSDFCRVKVVLSGYYGPVVFSVDDLYRIKDRKEIMFTYNPPA